MNTVLSLHANGFDKSKRVGNITLWGCSQCSAISINGHPTHESGCPNARHSCKGCNNIVPLNARCCPDCFLTE